jgi:hypothetical protein
MGVFKKFYVTETMNFEFRAEAFNVFNHTQWPGIGDEVLLLIRNDRLRSHRGEPVYPFLLAMSPRNEALGLGVRCWVSRFTATRPNFGRKPKTHSKLSISDQWI